MAILHCGCLRHLIFWPLSNYAEGLWNQLVLRRANFTKIVPALCEYFEGPTSRKKLRPRTWAFRVSFFANIAGQHVTQNYFLTVEF